jgi:hypothetical protein
LPRNMQIVNKSFGYLKCNQTYTEHCNVLYYGISQGVPVLMTVIKMKTFKAKTMPNTTIKFIIYMYRT